MQEHQVKFTGNAREYFGIWIVNVLLSIVTLGIYSAWAKVRDKKYFYGNTIIDDQSFDYHATGKQILIGRIIVVAGLSALTLLSVVNEVLYLIVFFALLIALPWIIVRALRFNARVSSYRTVRFNFAGNAGDAFITFFLIPIGNVFTLYLCTPFVSRAVHRFITNGHQYGDRNFEFSSKIRPYYKAFFIMIGMVLAGTILASVLGLGSLTQLGNIDTMDSGAMVPFIIGIYVLMIFVFVPAGLIYQAYLRNILFNNTSLDGVHHFASYVNPWHFIWLVISNAVAAGLTFGLMIPWGRIRLAKYMASVTALNSEGSLEGYTSDVQDSVGVVSSEYVDLEGFDIDIGL